MEPGTGPRHRIFLVAAAGNLLRHRGRTLATLACLVSVITPLLVAAAITEALVRQGLAQIDAGPEIVLSGDTYGRGGPMPLSLVEEIRALPGVERVQPRIVSRVYREGHMYTFLAVDPPGVMPGALLSEGRAPRPGHNEAVIGYAGAEAMGAYPGGGVAVQTDRLRIFKVVGLFDTAAPLATANLIWTSFDAGASMYDPAREATEIGIYTKPGYALGVIEAIGRAHPRLRLQPRPMVKGFLERGYTLRAGSFAMLWLLLLAALVPVIAVTSGFGLRERRREVALCRALGWHIAEILEVSLLEDMLLAAAASALSGLLGWAWLHLANGAGISLVFLGGLGLTSEVPLPGVFLPGPILMVWVLTTGVVLVGTLTATWRAASSSPALVLR